MHIRRHSITDIPTGDEQLQEVRYVRARLENIILVHKRVHRSSLCASEA